MNLGETIVFPLSLVEQRVLGVLIEKQKTTPDVYPMTINGLVAGCNQKSNRDPVLSLTDGDIEATLEELHRRGLVVRVVSGRADKWKHVLYEVWNVEKVELAILAELFLRGPQTEGELRGRVSRMDPVDDLEVLRGLVKRLVERGFILYLTPEGRRGTIVGHMFQSVDVLQQLQSRHAEGFRLDDAVAPARTASLSSIAHAGRSEEMHTELAELRKQIVELRLSVEALAGQVKSINDQLGLTPPTTPST